MAWTREELEGLRQDLFELRSEVHYCENLLDKVEETVQVILEALARSGTDSENAKVIQALETNM